MADEGNTGQNNDQTVNDTTGKTSEGTQGASAAATGNGGAGSQELTSEQATQIVQQLTDMGITPENAHEFVQTRAQYNALLSVLEDPQALLGGLRQNRPDLYQKILESATDQYLELHPPEEDQSGKTQGPNAELVAELKAMRTELNEMRGNQQQRDQQTRLQTVVKNYNENLDSLIQKIPGLKKSEQKAIKAVVSQSIATDRAALDRINQGVYVDLPRHIKTVYTEWTEDHKTDTKEREEVQAGGQKEFAAAAQAGGQPQTKDDWDSAAEDLARDLQKKK